MRIVFFLMFMFVTLAACSDRTREYGENVYKGKAEVFYDKGAEKAVATNLLDFLLEVKWLEEKRHSSARVIKNEDNIYVVQLGVMNSVLDETLEDPERINALKELKSLMVDKIFHGDSIELQLCNRRLEVKKEI